MTAHAAHIVVKAGLLGLLSGLEAHLSPIPAYCLGPVPQGCLSRSHMPTMPRHFSGACARRGWCRRHLEGGAVDTAFKMLHSTLSYAC